jgi:hypothetical protein
MDFLATIDHYRSQVSEVEVFNDFLKETNDDSDLILYLLMRA